MHRAFYKKVTNIEKIAEEELEMNYLIVGANGFLGSYFIDELKKGKNRIIATDLELTGTKDDEHIKWIKCDITNGAEVDALLDMIKMQEEYNIIYLAACHHPDVVQKNPRMAWNINISSLSLFLNKAQNVRSFFYPSTDTVYGEGSLEYYFKEDDNLNPVNIYGQHKALAEKLVTTYGYNVVRFPFLIGTSLAPNKKHFFDLIKETIEQGKPMEMLSDSYRSTISFRQAAQLTLELIKNYNTAMPKIVNVSSDKALSKYDVGLLIAEKYDINKDLIVPITISKSQGIFEAPRASTTLIDNSLLKKVLNIEKIELIL